MIRINAKNSYGAYTGEKSVYVYMENGSVDCCTYCEVLDDFASSMYRLSSGLDGTRELKIKVEK